MDQNKQENAYGYIKKASFTENPPFPPYLIKIHPRLNS